MDRETRRGALPTVVMAVISRAPAYGYDITQILEKESGGVFALKEGTLYPILYRLEEAKLIEAKWDVPARGLPRKYYQLTARGLAEYERRLSEWREVAAAVEAIVKGAQS